MTRGDSQAQEDLSQTVVRKTPRRLIPFLSILYIIAYLDRVNVSFAQLQMRTDVGFNDGIGLVKNTTQSFTGGLLALAASLALGGCLVLVATRRAVP